MVGRDALERAVGHRQPQQLLVALLAQRRRADVARALEVGAGEVVDRVGQVLQARLARHLHAARLAGGDLVGGEPAGDVDDEHARVGELGEADGAVRRLGLEDLGARARVVDRVGLAGRERALDEHVDRPAVLAVHHRQRVEVARGLEHAEEQVVGDHQHALVGEEDLEAGDALLDHRRHVGERALVGLGDRDVEAVVDVRGAGCALLPLVERGLQPAALLLDHEVDDARRPAGRGRAGAGVVVVDRARAAERHRHVRVVVDQARQDEAAGRVDDLRVGVPDVADGDDLLPVDQDVGNRRVAGGHDRAAADERSHAAPPVTSAKRGMISRP